MFKLRKAPVGLGVIQSVIRRKWPFDGQHFEHLYQTAADPWSVGVKRDEREKYETTLSLLPGNEQFHALEIGCSEGEFTRMLAQRCESLVAMDISPTALTRAEGKCASLSQVRFICGDALNLKGESQFDLITIMEMLYYLPGLESVAELRDVVLRLLQPGGYLLLTHLQGWGDYTPQSRGPAKAEHLLKGGCRRTVNGVMGLLGAPVMARAKELHHVFSGSPELVVVAEAVHPGFASILLRRA